MKYLIIAVLLYFVATAYRCGDNSTGIDTEPFVSVSLYLRSTGSATKISCNGTIVSFLQYKGERDTICVPGGALLKARMNKDGKSVYMTEIAKSGLYWVFPPY